MTTSIPVDETSVALSTATATTTDPDELSTIVDTSLETRLLDCSERGVLFTAGTTSTGNTVALSPNTLLQFYTQSIERLIAPFNVNFQTRAAQKVKYTATVSSKTDEEINISLVSASTDDTATAKLVKRAGDIWQGTSELEISEATYKSLSKKALANKPLGKVTVTTAAAQKDEYSVKLHKLSDDTVNVKFIPQSRELDVFYAVLTHDSERDTWNIAAYTDADYSEKMVDLPYDESMFQAIPNKALKHGANLPLIRMYRAGLDESGQIDESRVMISNQNLFSIMMTYLRNKMSKALVKKKWDGSKFVDTRVKLPESTNRFIAQLFFTQLMSDSDADLYSLKDYFESFMSVNWELIASHADMTVLSDSSDDNTPLQLAGSEIFNPNDSF